MVSLDQTIRGLAKVVLLVSFLAVTAPAQPKPSPGEAGNSDSSVVLSFNEFFDPSGPGLRPSAKILGLNNKPVTLTGFMVRTELTTKNYPVDPINRGVPGSPQVTTTDPYGDSRGYFIRGQAVGRTQAVHTAADIPISAYSSRGSNAFRLFSGVQQNTDVFFKLVSAVTDDSNRNDH